VVDDVARDVEALSFLLPKLKLNFILGYIPDCYDDALINGMCAYLGKAIKPAYSNIVVGDFNLSTVDWQCMTARDRHHRAFLNQIAPLGLQQLVHEPTRGNNILDLIFSQDDRLVYDVAVVDHLGRSDHSMVTFTVHCNFSRPCDGIHRQGRIDFEGLRSSLAGNCWDEFHSANYDSVDQAWDCFLATIRRKVDCWRVSRPRARSAGPHMPRNVSKLCRKKLKLWKLYKGSRTAENLRIYNDCRLAYAKMVDDWHSSLEVATLREGNASALFRLYRQKTGTSRTLPPFKMGNDFVTDDLAKAEMLNTIFSSNGVHDDNQACPTSLQRCNNEGDCHHVSFDPNSVRQSIDKLKPSHSLGPDGFSAFFYKQISREICRPLSEIFTLSFRLGKLPSIWRTANVIPVFKKGNAADPLNYRPIALTVVPCKIMETIIRNSLMAYLESRNLIGKDQFGFMPGRSTTYQLLVGLDQWTSALDAGVPSDIIHIDFQKAFESVVHRRLLYKLENFGVGASFCCGLQTSSRTGRRGS
jgi:hypothetical protein